MYKIRTFNQIAIRGLDRFPRDQFEVSSESADPHAILLRSYKLEAGNLNPGLRAVARAGAGVNNVPVQACTDRGIVVFNTPGANANSVKELVLAALLLASRDVVGGIGYVRSLASIHDEAELNRLLEDVKITNPPVAYRPELAPRYQDPGNPQRSARDLLLALLGYKGLEYGVNSYE